MKHTFLLVALLIVAVGGLSVQNMRQRHICSADNQQLHTVMKNWGSGNVVSLSRALSRLQQDKCSVGANHD